MDNRNALTVSSVNELKTEEGFQYKLEQIWLTFCTGTSYRYIPAYIIASQLGPNKSRTSASDTCLNWL